jgi:hypothetical protein
VNHGSSAGARAHMVIVLAIAFTLLAPLRADESNAPAAPAVTDPTQVAQHYQQVAAAPNYDDAQDNGVRPRLEDMLSEWFQSLGKHFGELRYASSMPAFESMLMSVLVIFALAVVAYILLRITRMRAWRWRELELLATPETKLRPPEFYDEDISQAVQAGDWHTAWLATWRQFLSRLERRSLVEADRTRTNREYLGQLRQQALPASALPILTTLVDAYDQFIYGRAPIGEADWNQFHERIEQAALLLHLETKRVPTPEALA